MVCKNCGCELDEGAKFCADCGMAVAEGVSTENAASENANSENAYSPEENSDAHGGANPYGGANPHGGAYKSGGTGFYDPGMNSQGQNGMNSAPWGYGGASNGQGYNNGMYGGGYNPGMYGGGYNPGYYQDNPDRVATVKEYLIWMLAYPLLCMIPGVGTILYLVFCIKHAFDNTYKARANFFKATLITMGITAVISVLIVILAFIFLGFVAETDYSGVFDEFYDAYNYMHMMLG